MADEYTVVFAFDACKYATFEADSLQDALDKAEDKIDWPNLCHQCEGDEIEMGDHMWTRVDKGSKTVHDDSREAMLTKKSDDLLEQVVRLKAERAAVDRWLSGAHTWRPILDPLMEQAGDDAITEHRKAKP